MAQFETSSSHNRVKGKKFRRSIFVDLTPMVDLAFLLISFFMLTTAMTKPFVMDLAMPETEGPDLNIAPDRMLTVIADAGNLIYYYNADQYEKLNQTDYSAGGLRDLLYENIERVNSIYHGSKKIVCIIKLTDEANYQNMVDLLDEMTITGIIHYAIQDVTAEETESLSQFKNK